MSRATLSGAAGLVAFLIFWEAAARTGIVSTTLVPAPSTIPPTLWAEIESGIWLDMVSSSLDHYLAGLLIGSLLGVAVGIAVALWPRFDAIQAWLVRVLRPIPPLAWIPFAIIWFGISETAAAFIISIGVFWINYFTTSGAVRAVDRDLVEVAQAFGHGRFLSRLVKVVLPAAAPGIISGLRAGLGQGWMTVVAAELFGIPGIGQRMMEASGLLATEVVVVYMLTIAFLYAVIDTAFVLAQKRILAWQP